MRKILFLVFLLCFAVFPLIAEGGKIEANDLGFSFSASTPLVGEVGYFSSYTDAVPAVGIGAVYHPFSFLSIEPSIFFSKSDKERDYDVGTDNGYNRKIITLGYSLGAFYYGDLGAGLYFYTGPRVAYFKSDDEETYETGSDEFEEFSQMFLSLAAGLKYMFNDNFAVFADAGFGLVFTSDKRKDVNTDGDITSKYENKTDEWKFTKGSLGATFYLW